MKLLAFQPGVFAPFDTLSHFIWVQTEIVPKKLYLYLMLSSFVTSVVTVPFLTALLLSQLFSNMVREWMTVTQEFWVQILADTRFPPWNYFTGGSGNSVAPESVPGSSSRLYTVVVDAWILGNKRGKRVVTVPIVTASLLG